VVVAEVAGVAEVEVVVEAEVVLEEAVGVVADLILIDM
jgi:hypothetical protein